MSTLMLMKVWYYHCYKVFFCAQNVPNFPPPRTPPFPEPWVDGHSTNEVQRRRKRDRQKSRDRRTVNL